MSAARADWALLPALAAVPLKLATQSAAAARMMSAMSRAAIARRRAQSARAADKALRDNRRAVATAAPGQVDSVSGQRLRPLDVIGAAAHVRRIGDGRPAHYVPPCVACAKPETATLRARRRRRIIAAPRRALRPRPFAAEPAADGADHAGESGLERHVTAGPRSCASVA